MLERRKVDLNQKNRTIRIVVSLISLAVVLIGFVAMGAIKMNQVKINKEDIEVLEVEQKEQVKILIRIDENVKNMKEDITELKNRR